MIETNNQLKSSYKKLSTRSIIECAAQCLGEGGRCLVYEFDESTTTCRLSDEVTQEKESNEYSSAKIYKGK